MTRAASIVSTPPPAFEMTALLNVLERIRISLYSHIAAAVTEAVANACDADADNVTVCVERKPAWMLLVPESLATWKKS